MVIFYFQHAFWSNLPNLIGDYHIHSYLVAWPQGYKTFSMLNSAEHEIYPAH